MISLFISTPYFPATSFCSKNQKRSRLSQESSNEKSLELSYLTSDTCPLMCDNRFQTSLSSGPTPKDHPPSPTSSPTTFFFFFYTKIHESLATGVTVRWIKFLLLPLHCLKSPQFSWISQNEGLVHPRSQTTEPTQSGIDGRNFQLCAWEMFPAIRSTVFYFSILRPTPPLTPKPHMSLSREEANSWKRLLRLFPGFMCSSGIYWHNLIMGPSQNGINGR